MRVPVSWLRDYVPVEMPLEELATRLSVSTAEVEGIERTGVTDVDANLGLFRVGRVLEAAKHPNADRLQLTTVDVGEGEPRSIVCGAWNFGAGVVDPRVFENVGFDPEEWSGFAFGCGLERTAQLRHDIPDIRALWEGDLRVLRQF